MKKIVFLIIISSVAACLHAQPQQQDVFRDLDAYVERTCHYLGDCPYALVVSKKGQIIHEKYSKGAGALGDITADSRWQLFSITKSFVSALLLRMVEEKVIRLDDPISKYLPAFKTKGNGTYDRRIVTIRHLASQTSGVSVEGDRLPVINPDALTKIDIVTEPGKDFFYSGLGMYVLELTLQAAGNKDIDDLMQEKILQPLGLKSAGYVYAEKDARGQVLAILPEDFYYSLKGDRVGSGLFANARDLNKFGQFWFASEKLFNKKLRDEAWTRYGTRDSDGGDYGLLWWLIKDHGGFIMSGHQYKINAVLPANEVVITLIRLPQTDPVFEFWSDKHMIVTMGGKL